MGNELGLLPVGYRVSSASPPSTIGRTPDCHRILLDSQSQTVSAYSLWWRETPEYRNRRVGLIGHFRAQNLEAACQALTSACRELSRVGCALAVGPMDGNTWNNYRLITHLGSEPVFFLEPDTPTELPDYFLACGFHLELAYFSSIDNELTESRGLSERLASHVQQMGVSIRTLDWDNFDQELIGLHRLASVCFRDHEFYQELSPEHFLSLYRPLRSWIDPRFVLLAERDKDLVGFAFAIPDWLERARISIPRTLILKTLGVVADKQLGGLGYHLLQVVRQTAVANGYERLILALMRETEYLQRRQRDLGVPFRRYGLYAKELFR